MGVYLTIPSLGSSRASPYMALSIPPRGGTRLLGSMPVDFSSYSRPFLESQWGPNGIGADDCSMPFFVSDPCLRMDNDDCCGTPLCPVILLFHTDEMKRKSTEELVPQCLWSFRRYFSRFVAQRFLTNIICYNIPCCHVYLRIIHRTNETESWILPSNSCWFNHATRQYERQYNNNSSYDCDATKSKYHRIISSDR